MVFDPITVVYGAAVGLSLGLTGGRTFGQATNGVQYVKIPVDRI